jgi:hypothetical protein
MSPLEFMQRLAALVPQPRLHLIRFHGVLAPNAKLRSLVVPQAPAEAAQTTESATATTAECEIAQARPGHISWARLLKRAELQPPSRQDHAARGRNGGLKGGSLGDAGRRVSTTISGSA